MGAQFSIKPRTINTIAESDDAKRIPAGSFPLSVVLLGFSHNPQLCYSSSTPPAPPPKMPWGLSTRIQDENDESEHVSETCFGNTRSDVLQNAQQDAPGHCAGRAHQPRP